VISAFIFLAAMDAAPTPATAQPPPAPALGTVSTAVSAKPKTLSDIALERKLGKRGVQGGTLSVAGASGMPRLTSGASDKEATEADARLAHAIRDGAWVDQNIYYNEDIKQQARDEWAAAAENCRKTPGCIPVYRENVTLRGVKPLRTGDEIIQDLKTKHIWGGRPLRPEDGVSP
jgi:hypothetical protein